MFMSLAEEPTAYQAEHIREALLRDPAVGELDVHVAIDGERVVVTGNVGTQERRDAIDVRLAELLPGRDVRNDVSVSTFPEERP
jgi:osmotically-inducible protein OsmY